MYQTFVSRRGLTSVLGFLPLLHNVNVLRDFCRGFYTLNLSEPAKYVVSDFHRFSS
jgi:hypothetical protein